MFCNKFGNVASRRCCYMHACEVDRITLPCLGFYPNAPTFIVVACFSFTPFFLCAPLYMCVS